MEKLEIALEKGNSFEAIVKLFLPQMLLRVSCGIFVNLCFFAFIQPLIFMEYQTKIVFFRKAKLVPNILIQLRIFKNITFSHE